MDELGLSLRLNFQYTPSLQTKQSIHVNQHTSPSSPIPLSSISFRSQPADPNPGDDRSYLRRINVNLLPSPDDWDDELMASSPNSTISSVSGKRCERETNAEDHETQRASPRGMSDEDEDFDGSRKKLRLSKDQSAILEQTFKEHNTLNPKQKLGLANRLNLRPRQVEVWFQNRRARTKLKQTEVDCEFLKSCCDNLTEENRRLQKEVHELRALKLSPQLYMQMTPPTTLTMCPSCERVAGPTHSAHAQYRPNNMNHWASSPPIQHHLRS